MKWDPFDRIMLAIISLMALFMVAMVVDDCVHPPPVYHVEIRLEPK